MTQAGMAYTDFVLRRGKEVVQNVLAVLQGKEVQPLPPVLCSLVPGEVNLQLEAARRPKIELFGYDLDHRDESGQGLELYLVKEPVSEPTRASGRFSREDIRRMLEAARRAAVPAEGETWSDASKHLHLTTHYHASINLAGNGIPVDSTGTTRLVLRWGDEELSSIPILHRARPEIRTELVRPDREFKFIPPHVSGGDRDFGGKCDISVSAEVLVHDANKLVVQIEMDATEPRSNWTKAYGKSDLDRAEYLLFTAPDGFRITRIVSPGRPFDRLSYLDRDHGDDVFVTRELHRVQKTKVRIGAMIVPIVLAAARDYTQNGLVEVWRIVGDTKGGESGSRTGVTLRLRPVVVEIRKDP